MNTETETITRIYGTDTAELTVLDQIVALDGESVILSRRDVTNGSGRVVGEDLTVSTDTADFIRETVTLNARHALLRADDDA